MLSFSVSWDRDGTCLYFECSCVYSLKPQSFVALISTMRLGFILFTSIPVMSKCKSADNILIRLCKVDELLIVSCGLVWLTAIPCAVSAISLGCCHSVCLSSRWVGSELHILRGWLVLAWELPYPVRGGGAWDIPRYFFFLAPLAGAVNEGCQLLVLAFSHESTSNFVSYLYSR